MAEQQGNGRWIDRPKRMFLPKEGEGHRAVASTGVGIAILPGADANCTDWQEVWTRRPGWNQSSPRQAKANTAPHRRWDLH